MIRRPHGDLSIIGGDSARQLRKVQISCLLSSTLFCDVLESWISQDRVYQEEGRRARGVRIQPGAAYEHHRSVLGVHRESQPDLTLGLGSGPKANSNQLRLRFAFVRLPRGVDKALLAAVTR